GAEIVAGLVETGNGYELRLEALTEDAGPGIAVHPGERAASEAAIDVDVPLRDQLGPRADRGHDDEIAAVCKDPLAGSHRLGHENRGRLFAAGDLLFERFVDLGILPLDPHLATALQRREPRGECRRILLEGAVLDTDDGELAGAKLTHQPHHIAGPRNARGLVEVEHEGCVHEEMRRLLQLLVQRCIELAVGGARKLEHDGGEAAAADLEGHYPASLLHVLPVGCCLRHFGFLVPDRARCGQRYSASPSAAYRI